MSKKPASGPSAAATRKEIDRIDRDLLKLLGERAKAAQKQAQARQAANQPLYDPLDEQEVLRRAVEGNKGPLGAEAVRHIYREILGSSRGLVQPVRVAYLGPKYSYSHLAAIDRFGDSPDLTPLATIKAVFEAVNFKQVEFGLVPIENSTDGRVVDTLDMFARLPTPVTAEVQLRVHHNLLGKCPRSEVTEVYSKPQALSQCREWLAKNVPQAKTIEMTSTALAAQIAADKPGAAAVASTEAGMHYGLQVIDAHIEDKKDNVTRFAIIGGQPAKRTGKDKTSLMLEIPHKPGALADAMLVFKKTGLNLTWIESFPMPNIKNEYLFFIELEGHKDDARLKSALTSLGRKTVKLEVLGSYPRSMAAE